MKGEFAMNRLKKEMLDSLNANFPEDDISSEAAIYWFANDYHSGQTSDLYSILSTSPYRPSPLHSSCLDGPEDDIDKYLHLVATFSKRVS